MIAVSQLREIADTLEKFPFGPPAEQHNRQMAGDACVRLCGENPDVARTMWKLIAEHCGGYMPEAAATALIRAANTVNLVPDVTPIGPD